MNKNLAIIAMTLFSGISVAQTQVNAFALPQPKVIHEKPNASFWMIEDKIQKKESPLPPLNHQVQTAIECDPSLGDCLAPRAKPATIASPVQRQPVQVKPLVPVVTEQASVPANTLPAPAPRQVAQEPPPPSLPK